MQVTPRQAHIDVCPSTFQPGILCPQAYQIATSAKQSFWSSLATHSPFGSTLEDAEEALELIATADEEAAVAFLAAGAAKPDANGSARTSMDMDTWVRSVM